MSTKKGKEEEEEKGGMAEALEQDALQAILELLPARALASAACVCRSWYYGVQTICSRPCIVSALSLRPNLKFATEEVLEKVLLQPFRPQFAIVFAGQKFNLSKISDMLKSKLPGGIVVIGCHAAGLIGLDVATNRQKEVVFWQSETRSTTRQKSAGLVLTVGYFPGVLVETIALKNFYSEDDVKNFVDQAGAGAFHGPGCEAPISIILLAKPRSDIKSLLEKLDGAFMGNTIVTGGLCIDNLDNCLLSQCFTNDEPLVDDYENLGQLAKMASSSRDLEFERKSRAKGTSKFLETQSTTQVCKKRTSRQSSSIVTNEDVVGLVFKQFDSRCNEGEKLLHCHVAASGGLVPAGPIYVVRSVRETKDPFLQEATTWLTCMRENGNKKLDGLSLFEDLHAQVGGDNSYLCIGIMRRRRRSNQLGQPEVFHLYEVKGADEEYLYVNGKGIKTRDKLRFYCTDAKAARLENIQKLNELEENVKSKAHASVTGPSKARKASQVGALMFSCIGRGEEYFGEANVDSGDFLERFPNIPLSGMFCLGEIGPPSILPWEITNSSKPQPRQTVINMYSTVCMLYSQDV